MNISINYNPKECFFLKKLFRTCFIPTSRQKTETASRIPLFAMAIHIMEKYEEHPQCINEDRLLPMLSNQKMNAYLKEIADLCGIIKP
jgi:hypothetical protein